MKLNRRQCLATLGTLLSLCLHLQECIKLDGYKFPVYSTDFCPRNETEWKERSTVLNCTEQKGYTCLPNEHFTQLLEFCYTDPWILIEEGLCLYLIKKISLVHGYNCHNFQFGCPTSSYPSTEIYEHPSCTLISNGCFYADLICKSSTTTKHEQIEDGKTGGVLVTTLCAVFIIICMIIMLYIYYRRKLPYCKRNIDIETLEREENIQFIPEQCETMKSKEGFVYLKTTYIMATSSSQCKVRQCLCLGNAEFYCASCPCTLCLGCTDKHVNDLDTIDHEIMIYSEKFHGIRENEISERQHENVYGKCRDVPASCEFQNQKVYGILDKTFIDETKRVQHKKIIHIIRSETLFYRRVLLARIKTELRIIGTEISNRQLKIFEKAMKLKDLIDTMLCDISYKYKRLLYKKFNKKTIKIKKHLAKMKIYEYRYERLSDAPINFIVFLKNTPLPKTRDSPYLKKHSQLSLDKKFDVDDVMDVLCEIKITQIEKRRIGSENLFEMLSKPVLKKSFKVEGVKHCYHISCVALDRIWVSDDENNLVLTNTDGDSQFVVKGFIDCDLYSSGSHTVNSKNELIFLAKDNTITILSKDTNAESTFLNFTDSIWKPRCVYCSPFTGDLLVGMCRFDTSTSTWIGKVSRYNHDRQLTQTIQPDSSEHNLLQEPLYITENNNGDIVISDDRLDVVFVTDSGGRHRFSYTGPPSERAIMPRGICTDALSHILVCDYNTNSVQMIDKDGQFLSKILVNPQGIKEPYSLSYDIKTHSLLVGSEDNNSVCVYRYIDRNYFPMINHNHSLYTWIEFYKMFDERNSLWNVINPKQEEPQMRNKCSLKFQHSFTVADIKHCCHISVDACRVLVNDDCNLFLTNIKGDIIHRLNDLSMDSVHVTCGLHSINGRNDFFYIDRYCNINICSMNTRSYQNSAKIIVKSENSLWRPRCVYCPKKSTDLLVGMTNDESNVGKVIRYNFRGEPPQKIQGNTIGQELFNQPNFITENNNRDIVVSNDLSVVVVTDYRGSHRFSYTGPIDSEFSPHGVCTDSQSNILVCDVYTQSVHIIDNDGYFISQILMSTQDIEPCSISYDVATNLLFVGSYSNNKLCVYNYFDDNPIPSVIGHNESDVVNKLRVMLRRSLYESGENSNGGKRMKLEDSTFEHKEKDDTQQVLGGKGTCTVTEAIRKCLMENWISRFKSDSNSSKEDIQSPKQELVIGNLYQPLPMCTSGFPQPYSYMSQYRRGYMYRPQNQRRRFMRQNIDRGTCLQTLKRATTPLKRTVPFRARNEPYRSQKEPYCSESEPYRSRNEPYLSESEPYRSQNEAYRAKREQ